MLNFDVLSPLRFKLLHDFQKLVVRLFPIFQAIFQVSQVTQRVLFSRGVVDCPACCDRLVTREREPWLLSVAKEGRERTRFKWSVVVWCLCVQDKTNERQQCAQCACANFSPTNQSARFLGFRRTLFFSNLKYKKRMTRPPRATKRYLSRTHKEERNTHTQREREREIDAPLGHDARRRRLQLSFVHQSVAVSVLGKSSVSNLFQRHTSRGKIRLQFFSFFFRKTTLCTSRRFRRLCA